LQNHKQNELEQKARSSARDQKRSDHKEYYRQGMWLNSGWGVAAMHGTQPTKYYNQCIAHINTHIGVLCLYVYYYIHGTRATAQTSYLVSQQARHQTKCMLIASNPTHDPSRKILKTHLLIMHCIVQNAWGKLSLHAHHISTHHTYFPKKKPPLTIAS